MVQKVRWTLSVTQSSGPVGDVVEERFGKIIKSFEHILKLVHDHLIHKDRQHKGGPSL